MNAKSSNMKAVWVDPDDAPELGKEFFDNAQAYNGDKAITRDEYAAAVRKRGRPAGSVKEGTKQAVSIRLSPDVLAALRASGSGWQARVDAILREQLALM